MRGRPTCSSLLSLALLACTTRQPAVYLPRAREVTITTVPLLVKEMRGVLPFLAPDFAPGGILANKEVYAFVPNHFTVGEGDTLQLTFYNPEDDIHSFVLPDLAIALPGQTVTHATYVAAHAGLFTFTCSIPSHLPMMWGQLEVLPRSVMAGMQGSGGGPPSAGATAPPR